MNNNSTIPPRRPLTRAIRDRQKQTGATKRSTIEILVPLPTPPEQTRARHPVSKSQPPPPPATIHKVATQTLQAINPKTPLARRQLQFIAMIVGGVVILAFSIVALAASRQPQPPPPTPTLVPLPDVTLNEVLAYLKEAGSPLANVQLLKMPDNDWHANQGARFTVQTSDGASTFLLLTYDATKVQELDAAHAKQSALYNQWTAVQISNILLVAAPGTPKTLTATLVVQLNNELVVPYRGTATPTARH